MTRFQENFYYPEQINKVSRKTHESFSIRIYPVLTNPILMKINVLWLDYHSGKKKKKNTSNVEDIGLEPSSVPYHT